LASRTQEELSSDYLFVRLLGQSFVGFFETYTWFRMGDDEGQYAKPQGKKGAGQLLGVSERLSRLEAERQNQQKEMERGHKVCKQIAVATSPYQVFTSY
jgi:hypothetical protein